MDKFLFEGFLISKLCFLVPNRVTRKLNTFYVPFQFMNYNRNMNRDMELVNILNIYLFSCITVDI